MLVFVLVSVCLIVVLCKAAEVTLKASLEVTCVFMSSDERH